MRLRFPTLTWGVFRWLAISCAYQYGVIDLSSYRHETYTDYPVEVYANYAKSIGLAIERRVRDNPPRRPADFWRVCLSEIDVARWRMRNVTGQIRKVGTAKSDI